MVNKTDGVMGNFNDNIIYIGDYQKNKTDGVIGNNAVRFVNDTNKNEVALTEESDIINLDNNIKKSVINSRKLNKNNISKEEIYMKRSIMYDVLKMQLEFLLVSFITITLSLVGIILYYRSGIYLIHPMLYIFTLIAGIGWGATAIDSIRNNKM